MGAFWLGNVCVVSSVSPSTGYLQAFPSIDYFLHVSSTLPPILTLLSHFHHSQNSTFLNLTSKPDNFSHFSLHHLLFFPPYLPPHAKLCTVLVCAGVGRVSAGVVCVWCVWFVFKCVFCCVNNYYLGVYFFCIFQCLQRVVCGLVVCAGVGMVCAGLVSVGCVKAFFLTQGRGPAKGKKLEKGPLERWLSKEFKKWQNLQPELGEQMPRCLPLKRRQVVGIGEDKTQGGSYRVYQ